jgi:hypothetical protein
MAPKLTAESTDGREYAVQPVSAAQAFYVYRRVSYCVCARDASLSAQS